ncbi:sulfotransferase family protein [Murinocardiopsis flavida]|uniref:Sulfotransferase family protein n=2 Tax=Murinocardiopsis flavida TaxID=645275 RepID=A0A2P8DTR9_9ACTN|nr:sulfotransferase family protein [Murinocardiopsis flavida]
MVHAHPRFAIPPETRFVLDAYQRRREFGDLRVAANRHRLAAWIVRTERHRFADLGLDPDRTAAAIAAAPPTLGSAIGTVFRCYAERFGKPRWGDKRPGYYQHVDVITRLFPGAQFVHVVRDGRDCVGSLKHQPWYRPDSYAAIATWAEAVDYGDAAADRLGPGSYHRLRFESLIEHPERELAALCAFLGEEYDPAMCEPAAVARVVLPARKTWHDRTLGPVDPAAQGTWRARLDPWEIELCETVLAGRLRANGYEVSGGRRASPSRLARYAATASARRLAHRKRRMTDTVRRLGEPSPAEVPAPPH